MIGTHQAKNQLTITVNNENIDSLTEILSTVKCEELNHLKITIEENLKGWDVYSRFNNEIVYNKRSIYYHLRLEHLPDVFMRFENLEEIDLSSLGLRSLPNSLLQLQTLKKINISRNEIELADYLSDFQKMPHLEEINIIGCLFDGVTLNEFLNSFNTVVYKIEIIND